MLRLKSNLPSILKRSLPVLFVFLGLAAFGQEKEDKTYIKTTEKGTTYELIGWETEVVYNPHQYTWFAWEEPIVKKQQVTKRDMVPLSEFDRPPVFSGECLKAKDQFACSNEKLREYLQQQGFDYPDLAQNREQEGLEYVTFSLNEKGKFEGRLNVISKSDPCFGCADAAADIVAGMEDMWYAAIKDGERVETQLTIPVRFKLIGFDNR